MHRKRLLVFAFFVLVLGAQTPGQGSIDSIQLGGADLRVGMGQEVVVQTIRTYFDLQQPIPQPPGVSLWIVTEKGKPQIAVGSLGFRDGRLETATKYWTIDEPNTEAAYANAIYGAVSSFNREGRAQCRIQSAQSQDPDSEMKQVTLTCGQKYLILSIFHQNQQPIESATVSEVLGHPQKPL